MIDLHSVLHSVSRQFPIGFPAVSVIRSELAQGGSGNQQPATSNQQKPKLPAESGRLLQDRSTFRSTFRFPSVSVSSHSFPISTSHSVLYSILYPSNLTGPDQVQNSGPVHGILKPLDWTGPKTFTIPDRPKDWEISLGPAQIGPAQSNPDRRSAQVDQDQSEYWFNLCPR
jgi:hypothetical protein